MCETARAPTMKFMCQVSDIGCHVITHHVSRITLSPAICYLLPAIRLRDARRRGSGDQDWRDRAV